MNDVYRKYSLAHLPLCFNLFLSHKDHKFHLNYGQRAGLWILFHILVHCINYFALGDMRTTIQRIDEHLRVQMIVIIWKRWKVPSRREWGLKKLGVKDWIAYETSNIKGIWLPRVIHRSRKQSQKRNWGCKKSP